MYVIAYCKGVHVYSFHPKLYLTENKAKSALKLMHENGSLSDDWKVFSARLFDLK